MRSARRSRRGQAGSARGSFWVVQPPVLHPFSGVPPGNPSFPFPGGPVAVSALFSLQGPVLRGLLLGAEWTVQGERLDAQSLILCPESESGVALGAGVLAAGVEGAWGRRGGLQGGGRGEGREPRVQRGEAPSNFLGALWGARGGSWSHAASAHKCPSAAPSAWRGTERGRQSQTLGRATRRAVPPGRGW